MTSLGQYLRAKPASFGAWVHRNVAVAVAGCGGGILHARHLDFASRLGGEHT